MVTFQWRIYKEDSWNLRSILGFSGILPKQVSTRIGITGVLPNAVITKTTCHAAVTNYVINSCDNIWQLQLYSLCSRWRHRCWLYITWSDLATIAKWKTKESENHKRNERTPGTRDTHRLIYSLYSLCSRWRHHHLFTVSRDLIYQFHRA